MSQEEIQSASRRLHYAKDRQEIAQAQADYDRALIRHQTQEMAKVLEANSREAARAADKAAKDAASRARYEQQEAEREAKLAAMTPEERARFLQAEIEANGFFVLYVLGPLSVLGLGWAVYEFGVAGLFKAINRNFEGGLAVLGIVLYAAVLVVSVMALVLLVKLGAWFVRVGWVKIAGVVFVAYGVVLAVPKITDGRPNSLPLVERASQGNPVQPKPAANSASNYDSFCAANLDICKGSIRKAIAALSASPRYNECISVGDVTITQVYEQLNAWSIQHPDEFRDLRTQFERPEAFNQMFLHFTLLELYPCKRDVGPSSGSR